MRYVIAALLTLCFLSGGVIPRAAGQVALPPVGLPDRGRILPGLPDLAAEPLTVAEDKLRTLRLDRIAALVRRHPDAIERDARGDPAVRGVLVAIGVDTAMVARARAAGFALIDRERLDSLGLDIVRFRVPDGRSLARAQKQLARLLPDAEVDVDHIYFASGPGGALPGAALVATTGAGGGAAPLGLIDGGVAAHPSVAGRVEQRGFARGAPTASEHGTAVASLLVGAGAVQGAAPGRRLLAADVYGNDPAGGSASAIARALGWLAARRVAVTTISLVGPDNKLLAAAVAAAQRKGMLIVAAVGNDGPAAPPAYPASYRGVLAVTGVDARARVLPEAGRALHVDFAAPGDAVRAATGPASIERLRGTSFAAPLVAGRLALHYPAASIAAIGPAITVLVMEARDLGRKGRDKIYGHGLICGDCGR
ncbi:S8 family serine peptidase [Sphingopyxis alaskensis]|jgi:subtilisin family serine protease|uniref:Peptidase S8 and S53, subtilisin, kexin, sedolisin n=1 Tax=Sphingopyxis alaskensis (strain DSM 13593 / LMG 18877 / RB2256) TaxID=317655 RepID=Q1GNV9_SPHAL|nr:S8 family serine peptidase [Sphingopyxis alaskensis]ABF54663.1 peptidase S8 and S53, subtilisin, kexin, sedolisin [Sphingopyxis alaskensis RB2256]MCM3418496.1 S8 family serine peptidase [Sphingopyxis alaskensis]